MTISTSVGNRRLVTVQYPRSGLTCAAGVLFQRVPVIMLLCGLLLAACGSTGEIKPPEMAYGQDLCSRCGMVIDDPRYAAALLLENNQAVKFDDAGEMFAWHVENKGQSVRAWFVHDYQSQAWLRAETAFFVVSKAIKSPMGTGVAVFGDRAAADAFAKNQTDAKVYAFDQAMTELAAMAKH